MSTKADIENGGGDNGWKPIDKKMERKLLNLKDDFRKAEARRRSRKRVNRIRDEQRRKKRKQRMLERRKDNNE